MMLPIFQLGDFDAAHRAASIRGKPRAGRNNAPAGRQDDS
jgi:hypothetical protein